MNQHMLLSFFLFISIASKYHPQILTCYVNSLCSIGFAFGDNNTENNEAHILLNGKYTCGGGILSKTLLLSVASCFTSPRE